LGVARKHQLAKHQKYDELAENMGARLLPFAVETCGGFAPDAVELIKCMANEGEEQVSIWSRETIEKHVYALLAVAIQRGNAAMYYRLRAGGQKKTVESTG
jgi:hypothetical protein